MSKDIKKTLEHCAEWNCDNCPNGDELGSGETVCRGRLLPEVLEYVTDLEAKLAESEKENKRISSNNLSHSIYIDKKIERLEQQLAEKEKQIERLKIYDEYRFELPYPKVKILGKTFEDIQELLEKWLKQGSKDKISFAVEQLEKVKEFLFEQNIEITRLNKISDYIDNQIKLLKEGK